MNDAAGAATTPGGLHLPLVYINLAEDTGRREQFEAAFGAIGVRPERFDAVRWTRLTAAEQDALYSEALNAGNYFRPLVAGEKGCYASHLAVWQRLLDAGDRAWVVLEDDVLPRPGLVDAVNAIAALPDGWDMVKLIGRERERPLDCEPLAAGFALVTYRRVPSLTAGYVLSRSGARKLLAVRPPFARPIDVDLRMWWESGLVMRGLVPAAIALAPNEADSSIGARHGSPSLGQRWRKFVFKWHYSLANRRAGRP